jgi:hypothetical protein
MLERPHGKVALSTGVACGQVAPAMCEETHGCPFTQMKPGHLAATGPVEAVAT